MKVNICNIYFELRMKDQIEERSLLSFIHPSRVYYGLTIDQLSVGLIAQLVEHCTGIAEVILGSNPVQA